MIRIDIPWIVQIAEALDRLSVVARDKKVGEIWYPLFNAKQSVEILAQSVYNQHIRVSRQKAFQLSNTIGTIIDAGDEHVVTDFEAWLVISERDRFKELFLAEVSSMPAYLVTRKESYDVDMLIDAGTTLFPGSLILKVPEAEKDSLQAGRALAFEVATACGFHVFRVIEAVVKRYWDETSGGQRRPKLQTLGNFAAEMEKSDFGDPKVVELLKHVTKHHRNPIIHSDVILDNQEAIGIVTMARTLVGSMLTQLPDVPLTTGALNPRGILALSSYPGVTLSCRLAPAMYH